MWGPEIVASGGVLPGADTTQSLTWISSEALMSPSIVKYPVPAAASTDGPAAPRAQSIAMANVRVFFRTF